MAKIAAATAIEKFKQNDVQPALEQALDNLEHGFQQNKDQLKQAFLDTFKQICIKTGRSQQITGYLIYHLLLTNMLQRNYTYAVVAYGPEGYYKEGVQVGEQDCSFIYRYYQTMWQQLDKIYRQYILKIFEPDLEKIMLAQLIYFHQYVVQLMRYSLLDALETEEYQAIAKADQFHIQTGPYFEPCAVIHSEAKRKEPLKIIRQLQQNRTHNLQDLRDLDLSNLHCPQTDLRYADLRHSRLEQTNLINSILTGAKCKNCAMPRVNLMVAMLNDANFDQADLTEAKLQYSVAYTGKSRASLRQQAGYTGASFRDSNLTGANLTGAVIMGADFTGADLTGAIFTDTDLYRSRFTEKQLAQTRFTPEQLKQIESVPENR
ncbi:MAG: pentapeptide repeat-containing protein [Firmicutes bacterium]|nr:pentapeptide repeat-containing protein [Bacillota bacterium]